MADGEQVEIYWTAQQFARRFGEMEFALKRSGYLKAGREDAQADWEAYAKELGSAFFDKVVADGIAKTLITEPPRKLLAEELQWDPAELEPLKNVSELMVKGMCRVRNSFVHGEKFASAGHWQRDAQLVRDALAVLIAAAEFAGPFVNKAVRNEKTAKASI